MSVHLLFLPLLCTFYSYIDHPSDLLYLCLSFCRPTKSSFFSSSVSSFKPAAMISSCHRNLLHVVPSDVIHLVGERAPKASSSKKTLVLSSMSGIRECTAVQVVCPLGVAFICLGFLPIHPRISEHHTTSEAVVLFLLYKLHFFIQDLHAYREESIRLHRLSCLFFLLLYSNLRNLTRSPTAQSIPWASSISRRLRGLSRIRR